jgi:hypothetical protein
MNFPPSKFESFHSKFIIEEACETTLQYAKGLETKQWFVRLGTKYFGDLPVPVTKGWALQVKNILRCCNKISKIPCLRLLHRDKQKQTIQYLKKYKENNQPKAK